MSFVSKYCSSPSSPLEYRKIKEMKWESRHEHSSKWSLEDIQFTSVSGLLVSAEWRLWNDGIVAVDPNGSGFDCLSECQSGIEILCNDSGSQTKRSVVGAFNHFFDGLEFENRLNWTENLWRKYNSTILLTHCKLWNWVDHRPPPGRFSCYRWHSRKRSAQRRSLRCPSVCRRSPVWPLLAWPIQYKPKSWLG